MLPIYQAIARAGLFVFLHAQISLAIILVISVVILWVLKPWRMKYPAATVINTPLIVLYGILSLAVIVPRLRASRIEYPAWLDLAVMFLLLIVIPAGIYYLLSRMDKDRDSASTHPVADNVLDYIGTALFIGFVLVMGFGNFFRPISTVQGFSWHAVTMVFIFIAGFALFVRFVLNAIALADSSDGPYLKEMKRYYPAVLYTFLGSTLIAVASYCLESVTKF